VEADIVLSTHKDYDHNDPPFYGRTRARKSLYTLESFEEKGVKVSGIAASHYGDEFDPLKPSDVIYLVEADGLRIAFMGDICQTKLTEAQLAALGRVDAAIIIMEDAPSYGYSAERSLAMLKQIRPAFAFPIHPTPSGVRKIAAGMGGIMETGHRFILELPEGEAIPTKIVTLRNLPAD
jgi:L-ascorbate metabolism protein UlaG (beta-lactamase superfamily)